MTESTHAAQILWQCRRHQSGHHDAFISYRVGSEASFAAALAPLIETVGLRRSNRLFRVFLDSKCLNDAEDWKDGFLNGLQGSKLIVYLISEASLNTLIGKTMDSRDDNVLLEIEAGLQLAEENKARIFPIVIGSTNSTGVYTSFDGSYFSPDKYPNINHAASGKNVRSTMSQFFRIQGARVESSPSSQAALCAAAERILRVLSPSDGPLALNKQIPSIPKSFTGREIEIDLVQQCLFLKGISLVTGLPGMGKSSVATKVAHNCLELYQNVFWISLESISSANTGFEAIAGALNLPMPPQASAADFRKAVSKWLSNKSGYLLVIDNADNPSIVASCFEDVPKFLGDILVTSRNNNILQHFQDLDLDISKVVEVESWNDETTCAYLTSRTKKEANISNKDVKAIVELLAGHSLSVAQAASYMVSNRMSYAQFVTRMTAVLASDSTLAEAGKRGSIGNIFQLFKNMCADLGTIGKAALSLLASVSYISPVAIPRVLILSILQEINMDVESNDVLNIILDNGWLRSDASESVFSTHAVIQELCHSLEGVVPSMTRTISALKTLYPEDALFNITAEQRANCGQLSVHVQRLMEFIVGLGSTEQEALWKSFKELIYLWLRYLERLERLTDFTSFCRQCLSMETILFGLQSLNVASSKYFLGKAEFLHGNYKLAKTLEMDALQIYEAFYSSRQHLSVASVLYEIGQISFSLEQYSEALECLLECLKIRVDIYTTRYHYSVGHTLYTLGQTYGNIGDKAKAKEFFEECLEIFETVYGTRMHADVSFPLHDLGMIAYNDGDFETAIKLYRESLTILEYDHGTRQSRSFASGLRSLGDVYVSKKNYSEAKTLYLESLKTTESLYTRQHPYVANNLYSLGVLAMSEKDYISAEKYLSEIISITEKLFGTREHYDIALALQNLGTCAFDQQNYLSAKQFCSESHEILLALNLGPTSTLASTTFSLGMIAYNENSYDEAKGFYTETLETYSKLYGTQDHNDVAVTFSLLGQAEFALGNYEESWKCYHNCLKMKRKLFGTQTYPFVARSLCNLAYVAAKQSSYSEAQTLYLEALEIYIKASDKEETLSTVYLLACTQYSAKNYAEARKYFLTALGLQQISYGTLEHPSVADTLYNLGSIESLEEKYREAQSYFLESIRISEVVHGNLDREFDARTVCALGWCVYKLGNKAEGRKIAVVSLNMMISITGTESSPDVLEILEVLDNMEESATKVAEEAETANPEKLQERATSKMENVESKPVEAKPLLAPPMKLGGGSKKLLINLKQKKDSCMVM
ncbi:hypothetical protein HDU79_010576 [Rhizoclosmatium sp. JEL0117]|nr:hypothetical protein HDU79_010576 [Rhizoclosmatium sp. JEL0117]